MEVQRSQQKPRWLDSFIRAEFYQQCIEHKDEARACNYFCCNCQQSLLCVICYKRHQGLNHIILQIFKTSGYPSVRKDEIGEYSDMRGICNFIINNRKVYFPKPRPRTESDKTPNSGTFHCKQCNYGIRENEYCSIKCKVDYGRDNSSTNVMYQDVIAIPTIEDRSKRNLVIPMRRNMRKGIPRRAPLF